MKTHEVSGELQVKKLENPSVTKPARDARGRLLPGNTSNPAGKPPGSYSLVAILRKKLQAHDPKTRETYGDKLIRAAYSRAVKDKNVEMIRDILNRVDGMPKQSVEHSGEVIEHLKIYKPSVDVEVIQSKHDDLAPL